MSEQSVYRIREEIETEQTTHDPADSVIASTARALERMSDHVIFEELVFVLMKEMEPRSIPIGGVADRGRDGATPEGQVVWTISLAKRWQEKVKRDLRRIKESGFTPGRVFAVTNRTTNKARRSDLRRLRE